MERGETGTAKDAIIVVDHSWGIKGLGPDGTLALGAMVIVAAVAAVIAWRVLTAPAAKRR